MKLSIIVPCFNEEKNIRDFYDYFIKENSIDEYELIFVDDFSNDNSEKVCKKITNENSKVKFIKNNFNKGLGGAIKTGILLSSGEFISIMMSDSSDSIEDLVKALNIKKNYKIVGIRPGEKRHEEMISKFENENTLVGKDDFVILNSNLNLYKNSKQYKLVKIGFSYNSFKNDKYLSVGQIKKLIKKEKDNFEY